MKIIKRSGKEVAFDVQKIVSAVERANNEVTEEKKLTAGQISDIATGVEKLCATLTRAASVEEIQDMVEDGIMKVGKYDVARKYITYRYKHALVRKSNTTDEQIMSLIECSNEEVKQENSNKNPTVNSVQRDYMAGEVSKDITKRFLLPEDVVKAHEEGIIHFHDSDYFAQHMHNCCLVNLEDMLQNGTVISETMIERPKSFSTACNIATQAIAQIASSQYGGQSVTLSHLVPFVDVSRQKFRKEVAIEFETAGVKVNKKQVEEIAEMRVRKEVERGCQVIQYQVITLMTTNGQAPFITVFMYLDEVPEGRQRDDLALVIEEMLKQRILGVKNEKGQYITPAFPKLIYVLDEDNIHEDSKYWYLTKLAAKCTAKRLVPDYISAKKMKELKKGDVYPCMGCRSFLTPDNDENAEGLCNKGNKSHARNYEEGDHKYYGRFNQGVVTINLVDVACSSYKNEDKFWELMEERTELCKRALM
ncbi:MAG: anaerobic ribonucleoside-triphosphate reductase, partial [Butyrivibrio sp.]|nr:anaerobic ribonucleoside-triphosphate reductase [Butyrivibrio sp.]